MTATVADLERAAGEMIRAMVRRGDEIVVTDSGEPVARIVPFARTITVSAEEARRTGQLSDEAILAAISEARAETAEQLER